MGHALILILVDQGQTWIQECQLLHAHVEWRQVVGVGVFLFLALPYFLTQVSHGT